MIIEFTIDFKVTGEFSLNKSYAGIHWSVRKRHADFIHALVKSELNRQRIRKRIFERCKLEFYYNDRLDVSNHGYITKMLEDALKGYFFLDDNNKIVVGILQEMWDGKGIKIRIIEV